MRRVPLYVLATFLRGRQVIRTDDLVPYPVGMDGPMELVLVMLGIGMLRSVEKLGGKAKSAGPERLRRLGSGF